MEENRVSTTRRRPITAGRRIVNNKQLDYLSVIRPHSSNLKFRSMLNKNDDDSSDVKFRSMSKNNNNNNNNKEEEEEEEDERVEIPQAYHKVETLPYVASLDKESGTVKYVNGEIVWEDKVFPLGSNHTRVVTREQVKELTATYRKMLQDVGDKCTAQQQIFEKEIASFEKEGDPNVLSMLKSVAYMANIVKEEQHVYNLCFSEIVKQCTVNCRERGNLLGSLRRKYSTMFQQLLASVLKVIELVKSYHSYWDENTKQERLEMKNANMLLQEEKRKLLEQIEHLRDARLNAENKMKKIESEVDKVNMESLISKRENLFDQMKIRKQVHVSSSTTLVTTSPSSQSNCIDERDLHSKDQSLFSTEQEEEEEKVLSKQEEKEEEDDEPQILTSKPVLLSMQMEDSSAEKLIRKCKTHNRNKKKKTTITKIAIKSRPIEEHLKALQLQCFWRNTKAKRKLDYYRKIKQCGKRDMGCQCDPMNIEDKSTEPMVGRFSYKLGKLNDILTNISNNKTNEDEEDNYTDVIDFLLDDVYKKIETTCNINSQENMEEQNENSDSLLIEKTETKSPQQQKKTKMRKRKSQSPCGNASNNFYGESKITLREIELAEKCIILEAEVKGLKSKLEQAMVNFRKRITQQRELKNDEEDQTVVPEDKIKLAELPTIQTEELKIKKGKHLIDWSCTLASWISTDYDENKTKVFPKSETWMVTFIRNIYQAMAEDMFINLKRKQYSTFEPPQAQLNVEKNPIIERFLEILELENVYLSNSQPELNNDVVVDDDEKSKFVLKNLSIFIVHLLRAKFGVNKVVDNKIHQILITIQTYRNDNYEIDMFGKFLEDFEDFKLMISFRANLLGRIQISKNGDETMELADAIKASRVIFESKFESQSSGASFVGTQHAQQEKEFQKFEQRVYESSNGNTVCFYDFIGHLVNLDRRLRFQEKHIEWLWDHYENCFECDEDGFISLNDFVSFFLSTNITNSLNYQKRQLTQMYLNISRSMQMTKLNFSGFYTASTIILSIDDIEFHISKLRKKLELQQGKEKEDQSIYKRIILEKQNLFLNYWGNVEERIEKIIDRLYRTKKKRDIHFACELNVLRINVLENLSCLCLNVGDNKARQLHVAIDSLRMLLAKVMGYTQSNNLSTIDLEREMKSYLPSLEFTSKFVLKD